MTNGKEYQRRRIKMINCKEEFLRHTAETRAEVKAAIIERYSNPREDEKAFVLPIGYTEDQLRSFLQSIDFEYAGDNKHRAEIIGSIWYSDGSWSERDWYYEKEWWEHRVTPDISVCA